MAAGFEKPIPFSCEMQWLDLGDGHAYQISVQVCDLLSIALNRLTRQLLLRIFSEEVAKKVSQSFRSGDVRQARLFKFVPLLFSDAALRLGTLGRCLGREPRFLYLPPVLTR